MDFKGLEYKERGDWVGESSSVLNCGEFVSCAGSNPVLVVNLLGSWNDF